MWIYSEQDIRKADEQAAQNGLPIIALMEQAGRALYEALAPYVTKEQRILILCGSGNNGGDGIVLARYLQRHGYTVHVHMIGEPKSEAARAQLAYYRACGFSVGTWERGQTYDVLVDALLGIGTSLPLRPETAELIQWANAQPAWRVAVDMPTGVLADSGYAEEAFQAHITLCLHGAKRSAFLLPSAQYYGRVVVLDIGLPHEGKWRVWTEADVRAALPRRPAESHKGTFGTGLLLGGCDEMPGSVLLAALGAMRGGIGKLVIGTTRFAAGIAAGRLPEATYWFDGLEKAANGHVPAGIRAAAIGPGLADAALVEQALPHVFAADIPLILDAGALAKRTYNKRHAPVIVTPHPGEFGRMTGLSAAEIGANRLGAASAYAQEQQVIVVLKGAHTVIAFPDGTGYVNTTGNSGLAKGGTGDTLTGLLLAFLCTHGDVKAAVANAVYIHGLCADVWAETKAEQTLLASDVSALLPDVLYRLQA